MDEPIAADGTLVLTAALVTVDEERTKEPGKD